jgi:hypothetical protein
VDSVAHRLRSAPKIFGYLRRDLATGARQKYLATTQNEGVFGAQPFVQSLALLFRKYTDKDGRFHDRH